MEDCFKAHAGRHLRGQGLCDQEIVDLVVLAPIRIQELIDWGTMFDRQNGAGARAKGGHSLVAFSRNRRRDRPGSHSRVSARSKRSNVRISKDTFTIDLITDDGRCVGALVRCRGNKRLGETGGSRHRRCGQLYRETTNPPVATGDGLAM
ncbi:MAG: FAD-binding protein [Planctomycetota bacterium]